ncbi:His Kinase A domain containing protein [Pleurotus pulmonarius]|nr:His Kinase A domain containing protein [Pleurotus pulmonarius]
MEQFSRECLEIDSEAQAVSPDQPHSIVGASMDKVYSRAAKLVKKTLDVEGVIVVDVSHCEVLESLNSEGSVSVVLHHGEPVVNVAAAGGSCVDSSDRESNDSAHATPTPSTPLALPSFSSAPPPSSSGFNTLPHDNFTPQHCASGETTARQLTAEEYGRLVNYFAKHPDGKISEGIVPPAFRPFLPTRIQYALTVPIFNVDKRPFALLCAYNASEHTKRFLEGHELSYLRAIGVIILSAVLKRRMALADKAKSLFISNISHELRTPLHGILAAAELLADTPLNHSQSSFLQTVQACGTSLVETVNHVLDFTKLSGNSKSGGVEKVIVPTKVDLMQLVEEAVDGCWVGYRARTQIMRDSAIGSVYSPPEKDAGNGQSSKRNLVETVVDIGHREGGWLLKCERGGIRRVLMNLFGNSLKFTSNGFIHVILRQLPSSKDDPPNKVKIELGVCDTGKGISQSFLKENPLQTGTGLGLAIVNSIVHSDSVNGTVDVWSEEGLGTELKVTFSADVLPTDEGGLLPSPTDMFRFDDPSNPPTVALVGFDTSHPGVQLLFTVTRNYLVSWWGFNAIQTEDPGLGDIVIINNDPSAIVGATERRDTTRPFLIFSALRGSPALMAIASDHENIGGFCRIVYKPGGPSRLRTILNLAMHALKIVTRSQSISPSGDANTEGSRVVGSPIPRRISEEISTIRGSRPFFPRSSTAHPGVTSWKALVSPIEADESPEPEIVGPTIPIGNGGTLLKSSVGTIDVAGYDYRDAVDGRDGVNIYQAEGPFDVVLLDLSMPVLDGIGATSEIRQIEAAHEQSDNKPARACILALTGMSSLEDKRRAFEAGVDGYLVKPVAFKTLEDMFHKLGIT